MVLTVSSALSLVTGLCCHHHRRDAKHHRQLDASVRASGPHGFAVRAQRHSSFDVACVHRIPHPTFVTIAKRPSCEGGTGKDVEVIWVKSELEYFCRRGWTDKWVICPSGNITHFRPIARLTESVGPAAVPPRMPAKSRPAHHADRRNNHRAGRHDHGSVGIATTTRATMCARAAAFRGLGAETCEAQQGGECGNRKNFSAHLFGSFNLGSGCL